MLSNKIKSALAISMLMAAGSAFADITLTKTTDGSPLQIDKAMFDTPFNPTFYLLRR